MSQTVSQTPEIEDRIKLPLHFDVDKMKLDIELLGLNKYTYYDPVLLRAPAHIIDPSLPTPPPSEDYADGSWTEWKDSSALKCCPYLQEIVATFDKHTKVTLVRLLRLAPDSVIKEHKDPTLGLEIEKSVIRLTIPIYTNDKVEFFLNQKHVQMEPGECWYLRLTDSHKVINGGKTERINLTIDMRPNDWVRSLIYSK